MKLQEFFDTQKHTAFTDIDKLDLYQDILYKKTKKTSLKRFSLIPAKYAVYSMIFLFMVFGIYGIYFLNNGNLQDNGRFSIIKNGTNTAEAGYIAQVIDAKDNFLIEHDGVLAKTNNIGNGDTIILKEGSQLSFEIASGGAQSKIIGPAKLIIQQTHDENYKLNLVYGDFIQMEGNERKAQTIEVAINDITVKQGDKSQPLNFRFVQDGEKKIFQNNGADIIVTKSNGTDKSTTISKQQVVAIQDNDIKIFANIDSFTKAIQQKNVSQTFALATDSGQQEAISGQKDDNTMLLALLETTTPGQSKEEITKNISATLNDDKKVLEISQDEKVSSSLYEAEYISELAALKNDVAQGNSSAFETDYTKIEKRIHIIYQSFGASFEKFSGDPMDKLQGLQMSIKTIRDKISLEYNVPPTYIENLQDIEKSLTDIIAQGRGSAAPKTESSEIEKTADTENL